LGWRLSGCFRRFGRFGEKSLSLVGTFIVFSSNQGLLKDEKKKRRLKERKFPRAAEINGA